MAKTEPEKKDMPLTVAVDANIVPQSFQQLREFADIIAKTDMVPKDYRDKPGNCLVAMMMGHEVGLPFLQALQNIANINGHPSIFGDLALALVREKDVLEVFEEFTPDEALAAGHGWCKIKRRGDAKPSEYKFSIKDAETAKLWKKEGPWTTYPGRMLQMRTRGFALRDKATDVLKGLRIVEEERDIIETTAINLSPEAKAPEGAPPAPPVEPKINPAGTNESGHAGENVPEQPRGYLIDKVGKSAHPGLFYVHINGVRYSTTNEAMAKLAHEVMTRNITKGPDDKERVDFTCEEKDGTQFLLSFDVVKQPMWPK